MAAKLGVARASVVAAYEHLLAEGYVESRAGSGTFISAGLTRLAGFYALDDNVAATKLREIETTGERAGSHRFPCS